ncbi:ABC transporter ATP-binding protein [Dermacoccaceae bacterium W4C1]
MPEFDDRSTDPARSGITASGLVVGYGARSVLEDLDVHLPAGKFTAVLGPNACGKSTMLRSLVRLLARQAGSVTVDGTDVDSLRPKELARRIAFLPQESTAPEGITVRRLVARGRYPHQTVLSTWSEQDEQAVTEAMADAGVSDLSDRRVDALSGGQRQRVWIAMVLAQKADYLLLDEPTTFLDIAHQYELLRLLSRLVERGQTVVAVLHEINQACRFADHLVVLRDGAVEATGAPAEVLDAALMARVFDLPSSVIPDPVTGAPLVVPLE